MMEKTKKSEEVRIDHKNSLWFLYRKIAEQQILNATITGIDKTDKQKRRCTDEK